MPRRKRLECRFELMEEEMSEGFAPVQRNAANARERARMRVLSSAFGRLKTKLPNIPADTKLSKLDTLRLATIYIRQLKAAVEEERGDKEQFNKHHATDASGRNISGESCRVTDRMDWPLGCSSYDVGGAIHCSASGLAASSDMTNPLDTLSTTIQSSQQGELWSTVKNNDASYNHQDNLFQCSANVTNSTNCVLRIPQECDPIPTWRKDERNYANRSDLNGSWQCSNSTNTFLHQQHSYDRQHSAYNGQQHHFFDQQYPSYDCQHSFYDRHHLQYEQQQYCASPSSSITSSPASSTSSASSAATSTANYV